MIPYIYPFTNKGMRLDPAIMANRNPLLNFDKGADETMIANAAAVEINRLYHLNFSAKLDICDAYTAQGRHVIRGDHSGVII